MSWLIMKTTIIMSIFLTLFAIIILFGFKRKRNDEIFFDKQDTLFLKGFWSIIIILVHIPIEYQNKIQDIIGSFAYVGVTFFFIASAFGLKYNTDNKKNYLNDFFNKRVIKLIFPMLIVNLLLIILNILIFKTYSFNIDNFINAWVIRLVVAYIIFWLFHEKIFKQDNKKADLLTSLVVLLYSLLGCIPFLNNIFRWNVEILGFVFGIYLYNNRNIVKSNKKNIFFAIIISIIISLFYIKLKNIPFLGNYILRIVLTFALNYVSFQLIKEFRYGNKINNFIGTISFETYLCHPGLIFIIKELFPNMNSGMFIVVIIAISILFSFITHTLFQKTFIVLNNKEWRIKNENITR